MAFPNLAIPLSQLSKTLHHPLSPPCFLFPLHTPGLELRIGGTERCTLQVEIRTIYCKQKQGKKTKSKNSKIDNKSAQKKKKEGDLHAKWSLSLTRSDRTWPQQVAPTLTVSSTSAVPSGNHAPFQNSQGVLFSFLWL